MWTCNRLSERAEYATSLFHWKIRFWHCDWKLWGQIKEKNEAFINESFTVRSVTCIYKIDPVNFNPMQTLGLLQSPFFAVSLTTIFLSICNQCPENKMKICIWSSPDFPHQICWVNRGNSTGKIKFSCETTDLLLPFSWVPSLSKCIISTQGYF